MELERLKSGKNLLAFSAGVDSTALFFLLVERNIPFDLAIVDYNLRDQSKAEVAYAKELAKRFGKEIFLHEVHLTPPSIEAKARAIRYSFFKSVMKQHGYQYLITAHQLDDQLEWFFMQLGKGAGLVEAIGMESITQRGEITIIRPLLLTPKKELLRYLQQKGIKYFVDQSNKDPQFFRNQIRQKYASPFMGEFTQGVAKSFYYLMQDRDFLLQHLKIFNLQKLYICKNLGDEYSNKRAFDRLFKRLGYLLSTKQKEQIITQKNGVIASKWAFATTKHYLFASPYVKITLDKKKREQLRLAKVPVPIRGYVATSKIPLTELEKYTKPQ